MMYLTFLLDLKQVTCVDMLLSMDLFNEAYMMSKEFLCFQGLMQSVDQAKIHEDNDLESKLMDGQRDFRDTSSSCRPQWNELLEFIESNKQQKGTQGQPLVSFALHYLDNYSHGPRGLHILQVGKKDSEQFGLFLTVEFYFILLMFVSTHAVLFSETS